MDVYSIGDDFPIEDEADWKAGLEEAEISFLYRVANSRGDKEPTIEDVKGMRRLEAKLDEIIAEQQCDQPAIVKGGT